MRISFVVHNHFVCIFEVIRSCFDFVFLGGGGSKEDIESTNYQLTSPLKLQMHKCIGLPAFKLFPRKIIYSQQLKELSTSGGGSFVCLCVVILGHTLVQQSDTVVPE